MATPVQRLPRYGHHPHAAPDWAGSGHVYRPRRPTTTPLYPVVQHHLETFLAQATERDPMGYGVPSWVEKDLRAYLRWPNQSPCSCSTSPCPTRTTTEGAGPAALPDSLSLSATSSRPSEHPNVTIHHGSGFFDGDGGNICYIIFVMRLRQKIRRR